MSTFSYFSDSSDVPVKVVELVGALMYTAHGKECNIFYTYQAPKPGSYDSNFYLGDAPLSTVAYFDAYAGKGGLLRFSITGRVDASKTFSTYLVVLDSPNLDTILLNEVERILREAGWLLEAHEYLKRTTAQGLVFKQDSGGGISIHKDTYYSSANTYTQDFEWLKIKYAAPYVANTSPKGWIYPSSAA